MIPGNFSALTLAFSLLQATTPVHAQQPNQDQAAKRLSGIVSVAVEEYGKAVNEKGKLISRDEFGETSSFLQDAREIAQRIKTPTANLTRAILDSMVQSVAAHKPPSSLEQLHSRLNASLGAAGAMDLPTEPLDSARGGKLYKDNCSSCHGVLGLGEGQAAAAMNIKPPAIGSSRDTPDLTPSLAFNVVSVGVNGTPMPSFAHSLNPQQRWEIINYVYMLRNEEMQLPVVAPDVTQTSGEKASQTVLALLDSALDFARTGQTAAAGDRAFDAYIAFEPLETPARAKNPGIVSEMERYFADFKGAIKLNNIGAAHSLRNTIAAELPKVVKLTEPTAPGWGAFFQSFLIILREGFEAILVIGAIVALLIKTGHRERLKSIWIGVGLAILASLATAVAIKTLFSSIPGGPSVVEGVSMLIAVVVLFSVSYWLISKAEAAKWQKFIREKVDGALAHGGGKALVLVAFLAVYREGAETALFYQALFNEGPHAGVPLVLGILVGAGALSVIFTLFYRFGVKIPMRPFFMITSIFLYIMAFVFAGKGIRELQEGNIISLTPIPDFPNIDSLGIFPTAETVIAQGIMLALFIFAVFKTFLPKPPEEA